MERRVARTCRALVTVAVLLAPRQGASAAEELLVASGEPRMPGGRLVVGLTAEPKTLNPVTNSDTASREVIERTTACLVCIDRETQRTTPGLAKSWAVSEGGRRITLALRQGVRFSDGHAFDADDVVFSFAAYQDEKSRSPQRDLLFVGGKPIQARRVDAYTVAFDMAEPYAVAERLFDGVSVLPRHLLEAKLREGKLAEAWGLGTPPAEMAGLGPFRLKSYAPGDRLVLERNPYYFKADRAGTRLPYLDELVFLVVPNEDAQLVRFQAGETDLVGRVGPDSFDVLAKEAPARGYSVRDLGPGLEYSFLFFNLGAPEKRLEGLERRQAWWKDVLFRRAVSLALDRESMVRLAFAGRATALAGHVTPGNKLWRNDALAPPRRSLEDARGLLRRAGFSWRNDGGLVDASGQAVAFSILTNASNTARVKMATIAQDDLAQLGMKVSVASLEMRAVIERVLQTRDYDACLLALGAGGDADPNVEMNVWLSSGPTHLWNPGQTQPATAWEAEIDRLMRQQVATLRYEERKQLYDRVQELVVENLPVLPLVAPHVVVAAKDALAGLRPAILAPYVLWNAEELAWQGPRR